MPEIPAWPIGQAGSTRPGPIVSEIAAIRADLDPHLQTLLLFRQLRGKPLGEERPVRVVALLRETESYVKRPWVRNLVAYSRKPPRGWIVTGEVPPEQIEALRGDVVSLKQSVSLKAQITDEHRRAIGLGDEDSRAAAVLPRETDVPVLVGIIDREFHPLDAALRDTKNGRISRVHSYWHQALAAGGRASRYGYGRVFRERELAKIIACGPPCEPALASVVGGHGARVASVAAASPPEVGMNPSAMVSLVDITSPLTTADDGTPDTVGLLDALSFIFDESDRLGTSKAPVPVVVNLSQAAVLGPHDGSMLVERAMDAFLYKRGRFIVLAAGNYGDQGISSRGVATPGNACEFRWRIPDAASSGTRGIRELDVWYGPTPGGARLSICFGVAGDETGVLVDDSVLGVRSFRRPDSRAGVRAGVVGTVAHRNPDPLNKKGHVYLQVDTSAFSEEVVISVRLKSEFASSFVADAWVENNDGDAGTDQFDRRADTREEAAGNSISSLACGDRTMSVGCVRFLPRDIDGNARAKPFRSTTESSFRDRAMGSPKPDVVALESAATDGGEIRGTSAAAPQVAGLASRLLSRHPRATWRQVRDAIRWGCTMDRLEDVKNQSRIGSGVIDARAAFARLEKILDGDRV